MAAIIGSQFKEEIILSIQLQNSDYLKYIIVDYQSPSSIRGYAQLNDEINYKNKTYPDLIKNTLLSVTIDRQSTHNQRYQGIVEVTEDNLSKAMEDYFYQSEQIKTSIKLSFGSFIKPGEKKIFCGGGIMIQQMPDDFNNQNWQEAQIFFNTIRDDELIDPNISTEQLLYSVYHEVGVKAFDYLSITHKCRCSKNKAKEILFLIGKEEALSLLIDDEVEINCQFCNKSQKFSSENIQKIFE